MRIEFSEHGWTDYLFWQERDRGTLRRINGLLRDIARDPFGGVGKPEPLKFNLSGCWSRRIDREHRLIYKIEGDRIVVVQCRYHY